MNISSRYPFLFAGVFSAAVLAHAETSSAPEKVESEKPPSWNWAPGEGLSYGETSIVSTELSLAFDSKYLSYGFVDNNEPILTPAASITFFDWVNFSVESIFDVTPYGRKKVEGEDGPEDLYANRGGKYTELDPGAAIVHAFSPDDYDWLPTTFEFSLGYMYEYHPRSFNVGQDDTQFITLKVTLPDLWIEPTFTYERDIDRDNGTYLNLELGHTFEVVESVTFRPSVAQGFGNAHRVGGSVYCPYATQEDSETPLGHAGLMDTFVSCELAWELADGVTFSGYVGYSDFVFDRKIREAARRYEGSGDWEESWNFIAGLSLTLSF